MIVLLAESGFPRGPGFYFSLVKLPILLIVFLGWVKACAWVNEDVNRLRMPANLWNGMMVGSGVAGLLVVWLLPAFYFSIFLMIFLVMTPAFAYIYQRDQRVSDKKKILPASWYGGKRKGRAGASSEPTLIRFISRGKKRKRSNDDSPEYRAALVLVYNAIFQQASEILLQPGDDAINVRYRIAGDLQPVDPLENPDGDEIVALLKALADVGESGRGRLTAEVEGRLVDLLITSSGRGAMAIRLLDRARKVPELDQLGLLPDHLKQLGDLLERPRGLILIGSPEGSGRTTTLYSCLTAVPRMKKRVALLENYVEMPVPNTTLVELEGDEPKDLVAELKALVRGGVTVFGLGDLTGPEGAQVACQLAAKERLVVASVPGRDAVATLLRPIEVGGPPALLAGAVVASVCQRLIRTLCPHCKVAYKPNPELLRQANLPPDKVQDFHRAPEPNEPGAACEHCGGSGYTGRTAIFEVLLVNDPIRKLIRDKAPVDVLRKEIAKYPMRSLQEDGLIKVVQGVTSVQELLRVCG